jgi:response regulator of citrate/malate metabolism
MTDQHPLTEWQQLKEHLKNFPDLEQAFFDELVAELKKAMRPQEDN